MSFDRPLHGGCQCGRNIYMIQFPRDTQLPASQLAKVLFSSSPTHRFASPLSAFLRVPLAYYHARINPSFPDETFSQIHKAYTSPTETHSKRCFCGFCGTPLSYWSEEPSSEKDFIQLALGSLAPRDLADLEELGLLPSSSPEATSSEEEEGEDTPMRHAEDEDEEKGQGGNTKGGKGRAVKRFRDGTEASLPWFDTLMEGSLLGGTLRHARGRRQNKSGTVRYEWEVVEWEEGDDDEEETRRNVKRKLEEGMH
ncbi:hypothetical protein QBC35DRAFT_479792 [Podospora australis]|uniref:CENP-V/GFA domain-containing protein n=1 Tax=Podospora australis TaxID=1536484 RepID=A0AAN7ALZ6_9PEZI|nr:hypothetical protein QBC35DRAFT_479792 [Podospora australis]